jgi:putative aldouronate transport system substrate-binding protein
MLTFNNKNPKSKKIGLTSIMLLSLLLPACTDSGSQSTADKSTDTGKTTEVPASTQKISFSYTLESKFVKWMQDLNWYKILLDKGNANVQLIDGGAGAQYYKNIDLKIASGDFPDAGIVNQAQAEVYGTQGAFLDLKPIIEKYAPNIKKYIESNPDYKAMITASDGKIYGLAQEYPKISGVTFYREDMFKKAGITKEPRTIEEFTDVLRKLKAAYADNKNFYPFSGRDDFLKFPSVFGAQDKIENGKLQGIYNIGSGIDIHAPGFKKMMEWYKQLYDEKLIDPEWVAGAANEESWQTKMLIGNSAVSDDFYTRPSWFMLNGGPKNDPNYSMKVLAYPIGIDGQQAKRSTNARYPDNRFLAINAKAEKKAPDIIKFLDFVFSPEGQTIMQFGVEGQTFKTVNGKREFLVTYTEEVPKPLGTPNWLFLQDRLTFPAPVNNEAFYEFNDNLTKSYAADYFSKYAQTFPTLKYSTNQQKERSDLVAKINEAITANLVKFASGKRPMSEFDTFLAEMNKLGYKRVVEIDQAAYDAMNKK